MVERSMSVEGGVGNGKDDWSTATGHLGHDVEQLCHADLDPKIAAVLREWRDVFPTDLPATLPLKQMGHEFQIDWQDEAPLVNRLLHRLSPAELA